MLGMTVTHTSGIRGKVDAITIHPDGRAVARIDDHWLFVEDLGA